MPEDTAGGIGYSASQLQVKVGINTLTERLNKVISGFNHNVNIAREAADQLFGTQPINTSRNEVDEDARTLNLAQVVTELENIVQRLNVQLNRF